MCILFYFLEQGHIEKQKQLWLIYLNNNLIDKDTYLCRKDLEFCYCKTKEHNIHYCHPNMDWLALKRQIDQLVKRDKKPNRKYET